MAKIESNVNRGSFSTVEAANEVKPNNAHFRLFQVTDPAGAVSFTWARDGDRAVAQVARAAGYRATSSGKAPTRDKVAAMLSQLSEEDRLALLEQIGNGHSNGNGSRGKRGK